MKLLLLSSLLILLPKITLAHTRWFADSDLKAYTTDEPTVLYLGVFFFISLLVLATSVYFHQHNWGRMAWLKPLAPHVYDRAAATFTMVCGAFFMIAGTHHYLFSPNLTTTYGIPSSLIVIQIIIGLAFLIGIATRTAAFALAALWFISFFYTETIESLENVWVLSTAGFIAVMGNDYFSLIGKSFFRKKLMHFKPYALSFLRLGTGLTLLVLGISEKIAAPELGINFLVHHQWNFMSLLGFNYSDYLFVLSAGTVESLLGLLLVVGSLTRLTAIVLTIIFLLPIFLLGPIELSGHLPHFAAIILLSLFGNGGRFLLVKRYEDAIWMSRVSLFGKNSK
jgi:uncharacterized membrane protein YphA (DoxX/SURF4 family)